MMDQFLDKKNFIAVVGVSQDLDKWGTKIFNSLKKNGFEVAPINPKYANVNGEFCYPTLGEVKEKIDLVILVVPPIVTEKIVVECKEIGIKKIWVQPGSESEKAIEFCKNNGIKVIYNACFVVDGLKTNFD